MQSLILFGKIISNYSVGVKKGAMRTIFAIMTILLFLCGFIVPAIVTAFLAIISGGHKGYRSDGKKRSGGILGNMQDHFADWLHFNFPNAHKKWVRLEFWSGMFINLLILIGIVLFYFHKILDIPYKDIPQAMHLFAISMIYD